ncbi:Relaxase/mobilization nuclease domain protein [Mucilaginibacter gotjawali]|nr:Relaxase/mobilization nuclease domain protein [Mucilaginibacter gotjawali]
MPSAKEFKAVSYNTNKIDKDKGELMKVANFGPLQGLQQLRPEDYRNYLKMVSATNKHVKLPQFHAAISAKGKEYTKDELTAIAVQWLGKMGYGEQPYLLVYHKDTKNNHIHMVTTRVGKDGKKISDSFEKVRAVKQLNVVLGIDEKHDAKSDIAKALTYQVGTKAQFMMVLESLGYTLKQQDGKLAVIKFGKQQDEIDQPLIEERLKNYTPDTDRKVQLKALFHKYAAGYDTTLIKKYGKYTSGFAAFLKEKLGIDLIFHASGDKPPYGYTVVDHAGKTVFKGGEIMSLKELLALQKDDRFEAETVVAAHRKQADSAHGEEQRDYYAAILKAALYNYPDFIQGLYHQGLTLTRQGEDFYLGDPGTGVYMDTADLLEEKDFGHMAEQFSQYTEMQEEINRQHIYIPEPYIAPDIDDEAIHGRNRRRKKKARTNHR